MFSTEESYLKKTLKQTISDHSPLGGLTGQTLYIYNLYITFIGVYAVLNMGLKVSLVVLFVIPLYFSLSVYGQVVSPGTCPNIPTVRPFNVGHVSIVYYHYFMFYVFRFWKKNPENFHIFLDCVQHVVFSFYF